MTDLIESLAFLAQESLQKRAFLLYDLDQLDRRYAMLQSLFPDTTVHAVAVKSNPLLGVLDHLKALGAGAECASWGECELALAAGYAPEHIVYDSPAKTREDLENALDQGIMINMDSFQEWDQVASILKEGASPSRLGLRINPQLGESDILMTSVVGKGSKFGVPLKHEYKALKSLYLKQPELTAIHVHAGSQGCSLDFMVRAVSAVYAFAEEINRASIAACGAPRITTIDIGGGASVKYREGQSDFDLSGYVAALKKECPTLFTHYQLVTEFGRWVHVHQGVAYSQVEYVKPGAGEDIAMIHFGADLLIRECYAPETWSHEIQVYGQDGSLKVADPKPYTIAGPLCFSGDIVTKHRQLPKIDRYDYLAIQDVGAYTFSMWSVYNSRPFPLCLGRRDKKIFVLRREDTSDDIVSFWGRR